jgi:Cu/Ag efflux protein CusF
MLKTYLTGAVSLLALIACSSEPEETPKPVYESSREITTMATVQDVDQDSRRITLKDAQGQTRTFQVDEQVRNLPQVKEGDMVNLTYQEAAAVRVVKKAERAQDDVVIDQADPGEKPHGKVSRELSRTSEILAIDKVKGTITLRGADDSLTTIWVRHPERLEGLKVGDLLRITYREAVAVSVQPASANVR